MNLILVELGLLDGVGNETGEGTEELVAEQVVACAVDGGSEVDTAWWACRAACAEAGERGSSVQTLTISSLLYEAAC